MCVLKNKIVLLTRSRSQSPDEIGRLNKHGAFVMPFPTICVVPVDDYTETDTAISELAGYDYLIFTSANSVKYFITRLRALRIQVPESVKVICIGLKTKEYCSKENLTVSIVPAEYSAKGILESLAKTDLHNKKVLIPSSVISRDQMSEGLKDSGASVTSIPVYNVQLPDPDKITDEINFIKENHPHAFIFTSPSSFRNFLSLLQIDNAAEYFKNSVIIPIGSTTNIELNNYSVKSDVLPEEFTVDGCVHALIQYYSLPG